MSKKIIIRNILFSFALQLVTIANGLITPKIFISFFGSAANGLVTSINQFLNYVTLLEGGLSSVALASLYKPLRENDQQKISAIANAIQRFFKQIGFIYILYAAVLAVVYPLFVDTAYSYTYVLVLVLVLAINLFTQYFFSLTYQVLIKAAQKVYLISGTKAVVMILNIVLILVVAKLFPDLILIKALSATVLFLQPLIFWLYTRKHFKIDKKIPPDNKALSQRWSGFGHTFAYFINSNVGVFMLTFFSTLSAISVYSVHLMVTNSIRNFAVSIASALVPSLGTVMAKEDQKESNTAFNLYEFGMSFFTVLLFTCGIVLITPFIKVYTANVTDANYIQPAFAVVLMLAEMIYCFRDPYINASYAAGHFKQTAIYAYIETGINIVLCLLLVPRFNLLGVAIALLCAMSFRFIAHIFYLKKNILFRPVRRSAKIIALFFGAAAAVVLLSYRFLPLNTINSYLDWFINAVIVAALITIALALVSIIFFRAELKKMLGRRKKAK